jgi:hypothetical protein
VSATISLLDAEAIYGSLAARFADAVTTRAWTTAAGCFASDCRWTIGAPLNLSATGNEGVAEMLKSQIASVRLAVQIAANNVVFEHSARHMRGRSTMLEQGLLDNETSLHYLGIYHDELTLENGEWVFSSRRFEMLARSRTPIDWRAYRE